MTRRPDMSGLGAAFVLARKDLRMAMSYRVSFFLGYVTLIFAVVPFYFLTRVVGSQNGVVGSAEDYFRFLIVGLMVSGLVETAFVAATAAARRDQMQGTLEAVVSLPVSTGTLALGWIIWPTANSGLTAIVLGTMALPLGLWGITPSWPALLVAIILVVVLFSAISLFGAALVIAFQQGSGGLSLVMAAIGMISGTLFPVSVMPQWLQTISYASPLRHALDATRAAALDGSTIGEQSTSFIVLAGFATVLLALGLLSLEIALKRARRTGSLGKY